MIKLDPQYGVRAVGEPITGEMDLDLEKTEEELAELEAEADDLLPATFVDSAGTEREYPVTVTPEQRDDYQSWWNAQVEANADNHRQPIALLSPRDYDSIA